MRMFKTSLSYSAHVGVVKSLSWKMDRSQLVSGSTDNKAIIWDTKTGKPVAYLPRHSGYVNSVSWSPDGTKIATGCQDQSVTIFDAASHEKLVTITLHSERVVCVAWLSDSTRVVSVAWDTTVRIASAATGEELAQFSAFTDRLTSVAAASDGTKIASASDCGTLRMWSVDAGSLPRSRGHGQSVNSIAFLPTRPPVLISASSDRLLKAWSYPSGKLLKVFAGHTGGVNAVVASNNGTLLASGDEDSIVCVWSYATGTRVALLKGHERRVRDVAFDSSDKRVASASEDMSVIIWDLETLAPIAKWTGFESRVTTVQYSPDRSRWLLAGSHDGTVRILCTETQAEVRKVVPKHEAVNCARFSPCGTQIVIAAWENEVTIVDFETGTTVTRLAGHGDIVNSVSFCSGKVASSSRSGSTLVWDVATKSPCAQVPDHDDSVTCVCWSTDDGGTTEPLLATSSADKTVRVLHSSTGKVRTVCGNSAILAIVGPTKGSVRRTARDQRGLMHSLGQ